MTREEAIRIIEANCSCSESKLREACAMFIPELRESEDERIRKWLVDYVKRETGFTGYPSQGQVLAWLEKQKEDKDELVYRLNGLMQDYIKEGKDDEEKEHRLKCYQLFWNALEDTSYFYQKEQKPEIELKQVTEEQLHNLNEAIKGLRMDGCECMADSLHSLYIFLKSAYHQPMQEQKPVEISDFKTKLAEYLQNKTPKDGQYVISSESILEMAKEELLNRGELKEPKPAEWNPEDEQNLNVCLSYIKDEPLRSWLIDAIHVRYDKPAWSEEDNEMRLEAIRVLESGCERYRKESGCLPSWHKVINWLKSLRPQPKQEWSEEDEKMREKLINLLGSSLVPLTYKEFSEYRFWLKSLRPGWKPTDKQMKALQSAKFIYKDGLDNSAVASILESLYNDLKKL